MKTLTVNDYDMRFLDLGDGSPLVCVHGSLSDFRVWAPALGPLMRGRRIIAPSLRRYFPERWDGKGDDFTIPQHVDDMIDFLEALDIGPVDLLGHSRGGHIAFRVAERRPELVRKLVLAEPGGALDESMAPPEAPPAASARQHVNLAAERIAAGDIDGGLRIFKDSIDGEGAWDGLPEAERQLRRDNAGTLLAQGGEKREPYSKASAESIRTPTLLIGGGDTPGQLPIILRAIAGSVPGAKLAIIPNATHVMFVQQPEAFGAIVQEFLGT